GKKTIFDLGDAEVILPVAAGGEKIPLRHAGRYLAARHEADFIGLKRQREELALLKRAEAFSPKFRYNQRRQLRLFLEAGGGVRPVSEFSPSELAAIYIDLFQRRWEFPAPGAAAMAEVFALLRDWMRGSVLTLHGEPVAVQVLYRVEAAQWISVEYINGGIDPQAQDYSPGSVLISINTEAAQKDAAALGKALRYSFGRAGRGYKDLWCVSEPVFQT
ncbi:MAG: antimicrobial resistance protein Mig-14, partial [Candidatus Accumulibacter sp.]|nr:antimicrobial resistance protein Mig-14 [Accumulibacter sp.]